MTSRAVLSAEPSRVPKEAIPTPPAPAPEVARNVAVTAPSQHDGCPCGGICPRCSSTAQARGESPEPEETANGTDVATTPETPAAIPAQTPAPVAAPAVSTLSVNVGSTGSSLVHVPACGTQPAIRFTAGPAAAAPITWTVAAGTAALDPGTTLVSPAPAPGAANPAAATLTAELSLGAAQVAGTLSITATNAQGGQATTYLLASNPTGITSTTAISNPVRSTDYGGVFDHVFTSADSNVASLDQVAVGERFPNLPNPTTATHTFATPFGDFTLTTGTLPDAASAASGNWFLTSAGELGGSHDNVTIAKSMIDIGKHLVSDSNLTPTDPLPAGFTVDQQFHWWCPHAAAGSRWTMYAATTHTRRLRIDSSGTDAEFVAIVNGQENAMPYEGRTGVTNAQADTPTVEPSPATGSANTVQISADAFPSTAQLHFSIQGPALGCTINASTGVLTIGRKTGVVTVRAANARGGPNWDEVQVTIAVPAAAPPAPSPPTNPPTNPPPSEGSIAPPTTGDSPAP